MTVAPMNNRTISQAQRQQHRQYGLLITFGTLFIIELISRMLFRVPTPGAILLLPVAYAAYMNGLKLGLISATMMVLYSVHFFSPPGALFQPTNNLPTILVLAVVAVVMVFMMGSLRQRIEQLNSRNLLILHSAADGICGLNAHGIITFLNPAAATLCGWTEDALLGQPFQHILRSAEASTDSDIAALSWDLTHHQAAEARFLRKDGSTFMAEYISAPIVEHRTVTGAVVTFRDISKRLQAEEELREREASFRLMFANNPLPMWVFDLETLAFLEVNTAAVVHYGYSEAEFLQMRIADIRPPNEVPGLVHQVSHLTADLAVSGPWQHRLKDGQIIRVIVHSHRLVVRERSVVLAVIEDITERYATEMAMQELNADLERRVQERTVQLESINKELESFSYSVSHDLRAPLRSIDGFSLALLEDYGDQIDIVGQDYLRRIRAATQRMAQLIDDLLGLARVTRSELHYDRVNLSAYATQILADLQQNQPDRVVKTVIAPDLAIQGDEHLLHLALENLLSNAWKFTAKCANPEIEFGVLDDAEQRVYFVRDNGAGFDMAYASKLFGAFQRLHAMTEFAGTGIGLATVQRIIHRHSGRIWAEGAVGQGATFFFTL